MDAQQIPYYLAFNCVYRLRSSAVVNILNESGGDAVSAWQHPEKWAEPAALGRSAYQDVLRQRTEIDPEKLYGEFLKTGCGLTCFTDEDYPVALMPICDPPLLLFYRGVLPAPDELALAVIGSRRATAYGKQVAELFSKELAERGAWIVSGMARGIDSICHRGALAVGGRTLAVLGCGLDVIYPPENRELYAQICDNGAVVSEFPLGMAALAQNFPRRNRLISGFSQGVIVVEADLRSGTMLTVDHALEQGKDVFAVPGPITSPCSRGTNKLIKECPSMVMATCAEDIWSRYADQPWRKPAPRKTRQPSSGGEAEKTDDTEEAILRLLSVPVQIDQIAAKAGLDISAGDLSAKLMMMEIKGLVKQLPGKYYQTVARRI